MIRRSAIAIRAWHRGKVVGEIRDWHTLSGFYIGLTCMAVHFGTVVVMGGSPIKPSTYGSAIYQIPALAWVAVQLAGSISGAVGALFGSRPLLFLGGAMATSMYFSFATLGLSAVDGILLVTSSLYNGVPAGLFTIYRAVRP